MLERRKEMEALEIEHKENKASLEHTQKKLIMMRDSHDEERKRWAARDAILNKVEHEKKELEKKYKQAKEYELEFQKKISKTVKELEEKEQNFELQRKDYEQQLVHLQSDEYVMKRLQNCIKDTRDGKGNFSKNNSLYDSFMKMNIAGDEGGKNKL